MVDFTAKWCPNCQLNLIRAINTPRVEQVVNKYGVVPLKADWTDPSPDIDRMLHALNSRSIPVLAIFPAESSERADRAARRDQPIGSGRDAQASRPLAIRLRR